MHTEKSLKVAAPIQSGSVKTSALGTDAGGRAAFGRLWMVLAAVLGIGASGCDEGHDGDRYGVGLSLRDLDDEFSPRPRTKQQKADQRQTGKTFIHWV